MAETSVARCYDELADDHHLTYPDWDASLRRADQADQPRRRLIAGAVSGSGDIVVPVA
ncbi:hypothetical protein [Actinocatenispora comari]|jgi:hypothetical protein|nr:hypothetical protein [Actinocatenispora comari]